jgi:hypothetical protein
MNPSLNWMNPSRNWINPPRNWMNPASCTSLCLLPSVAIFKRNGIRRLDSQQQSTLP